MTQIKLKDGSDLKARVGECYCYMRTFVINGIEALTDDFGTQFDTDPPERDFYYGCGNMQFIPKKSTTEVLDKYKITQAEYEQICKELDCLSFGSCSWCD